MSMSNRVALVLLVLSSSQIAFAAEYPVLPPGVEVVPARGFCVDLLSKALGSVWGRSADRASFLVDAVKVDSLKMIEGKVVGKQVLIATAFDQPHYFPPVEERVLSKWVYENLASGNQYLELTPPYDPVYWIKREFDAPREFVVTASEGYSYGEKSLYRDRSGAVYSIYRAPPGRNEVRGKLQEVKADGRFPGQFYFSLLQNDGSVVEFPLKTVFGSKVLITEVP